MMKKIQKIFFDSEIVGFELAALNTRFYWERILVIGSQYGNKQSQDFRYYYNRTFGADFCSEWSKNIRKIVSCRFKQSFGPFNMFTVHKCSDTGLYRHLSNPLLAVYSFRKKITSGTHYFFKVFEISCRFRKLRKKSRKFFLLLR